MKKFLVCKTIERTGYLPFDERTLAGMGYPHQTNPIKWAEDLLIRYRRDVDGKWRKVKVKVTVEITELERGG